MINFAHDGLSDFYIGYLAYSADNNSIKIQLIESQVKSKPFKLTVFYKG